MKIPILWRLERWITDRKEAPVPGSYCAECGSVRFIQRKKYKRCVKCGHKQ